MTSKILDYAKNVEKLVDPMAVGKVHYLQTKMKHLPIWAQRKIVTKASEKASKMPFVVEPYCTFLFYEIKEPAKIQKYLPEGFEPAKTAVFENGPEKYYGIVTMFRIHTSVFWGARTEFYLVAENKNTGLLSWIMCDYISDTISYDEKHGLKSPDAKGTVMTTTCEGDFVCDTENAEKTKYAKCGMSLLNAKMKPLNQRLWIEGNTSIAYGRTSGQADGDLFSLTFFPEEMKQALEVPLKDVRRADVFCSVGKVGGVLERAASFPYAQHMLSDSPGQRTHYGNEQKLRQAVEAVDFSKIKTLG
ncbi:hypothetical protein IJG01_01190 [Candidatus Saccharibacteria bacterium]|nr:hypothetical protein [Candidatus Saccharibacteria bacterium]MBR0465394.1 hypothetical protein [Candidatus Saccharibacteria bacterium]